MKRCSHINGFGIMVCALLLCQLTNGQVEQRFTIQTGPVSFQQFVRLIEAGSGYRFFYDTAETKAVQVAGNFTDQKISDLLKKVFIGTPFHFALDPLKHIYISKNEIIVSDLPPGFFNHRAITDSSAAVQNLAKAPAKKVLRVSLENKLLEIGTLSNSKGSPTLAGYIRDIKSGEPIAGASVYVDSLSAGAVTDQFGFYSLTLPRGRHTLMINSPGMKNTRRQILLHGDGKLDIEMADYIASLKEVVVTAERRSNVRGLQMGLDKLTARTIKIVPVVFGESDLLKVVLTLPGVTSVGEASGGFNVRGGSTDQNLILLNDATVYNPSHMFGLFSAFNTDIVKSVDLYKSAIPEKYGGRLSSVLDVTTKEGNSKKISGTGGLGLLTSKLTVEGPIVKDRTTFIVSGRTTYSDWLLHLLPDKIYKNSSASFSDLNLHVSHTIDARNSIYLNGYWSGDHFIFDKDTSYQYGNRNINIRWKHLFDNKSSVLFSAGTDHYDYDVKSTATPVNAYDLSFAIDQGFFRADFTLDPSPKHHINFGLNTLYYKLHPGNYLPLGSHSLVVPDRLAAEQALENAVYAGDEFALSSRFSLSAGLRYALYSYLGPHDQYRYSAGVPKDPATIIDTTSFRPGRFIKSYGGPEVRLALRYSIGQDASIKLSYNTLRQYIHMLTNTTSVSPTDIWKLSDTYIEPQLGAQLSAGYYKNFRSGTIETSFEVYYKRLTHYLDYKSGAVLVMNHHIETDVINTSGKAYGAELFIKKLSGKLNGWISYTYSRTFLRSADVTAGESVNNGRYYPADFDKPHNLNLISNYKFSHRYSMSLNLVYSTGRPITLPIAIFDASGGQRVYYSDRNQYRIPDYFRADFAFTMDGNHKVKQWAHNSWSIGIYNLTGRKNPYSVYFVEENGTVKSYQLSIFGTAIPFITYNFRF